ncbi:hypothetical protein [Novosphingobium sp. ERN07]|uniref:hypothetical protein n=1 Tax=Novosphingobium sp. ERN07 TaxID=2726187 RepID=UPI001456FEFE|nr:hypothetical protein [Novosphingobium sp. ERN07]
MNTITLTATVAPAQAGAGLFFSSLVSPRSGEERSQAPDQVRGDDDFCEGLLNA